MKNRQLKHSRRGMTLVELLVVVAILGILLAVSVPMLRPMFESRRTSNAAQVLAGAFKHARLKAIKEQQNYALRLIPFENAPTTAIQLRLQKGGTADAVNPPGVRVKVEDGVIVPYYFETDKWIVMDKTSSRYDETMAYFTPGNRVQFNRIGRMFEIGDDYTLAEPYDELTLPDDPVMNDAMEYRVTGQRDAVLAGLPPVVMPRGTIVDIAFSGGGENVPIKFDWGDEVVVMFSPAGNVDRLYVFNNGEQKGEYRVNEMLYFCVGEWDRQVDAIGKSLAEDGKTNLESPATYWVTLHPKTGGVRTAENAPVKPNSDTQEKRIQDARKFAKEHFFNVGN